MADNERNSRFIITSLPRCGSTTLARVLNCHPMIQCLIEPFHPKRYEGCFHKRVTDAGSLAHTLKGLWTRWNGIKHVYEASGWPFREKPELNDLMLLGHKVIVMTRRNMLKRYISHYMCRHTNYWIGSKQEFQLRIASIQIPPIEPALVRQQIRRDIAAAAERTTFLQSSEIDFMNIVYEDLYLEKDSRTQTSEIAKVMKFIGVAPTMSDDSKGQIGQLFDRGVNQWSSLEVYKMVPGIELVERELASEGLGSIFED